MNKVNRNIMINKAGGNASKGGMTYRISLPVSYIHLDVYKRQVTNHPFRFGDLM